MKQSFKRSFQKFLAGLVVTFLFLSGPMQAYGAVTMEKIEALGPQDYEQMFRMAPHTDGAYSEGLAGKLEESFVFHGEAFLSALLAHDAETQTRVMELLTYRILENYPIGNAGRAEAIEADLAGQLEQAEAKANMIRDILVRIQVGKKDAGLQ